MDSEDEEEECRDEDVCWYLALILSCPREAMFLSRRMDRAAPQSMKAKVAPFHNFILERGGALKLCRERERKAKRGETDERQTCSNTHTFLRLSH